MVVKKYIVRELTVNGEFKMVVTGSTRFNKELDTHDDAEDYVKIIHENIKWGLTLVILPIYKEEY